jgi:circadian clock protein KaiC
MIVDLAVEEPDTVELPRISTGSAEADQILGGGYPANSINLIMGGPGTGKTIFVEQLIFHNASDDRPILFLTTLSEPLAKVVRYLQGFSFFDETKFGTAVIYDDLGPALAEEGVGALIPRVRDAIQTMRPKIIVIDSFRAIHDLSHDTAQTRRLIYSLTGLVTAYDTTVFLLGEYAEPDIGLYPEFAVADSIVETSRRRLGKRDERYFSVFKLRGSSYEEGAHAFRITDAGLQIYPRLVSPATPREYKPLLERVSMGVPALDAMLDGGLWRGSTTILAGPSGSGKTTLALQFALDGARRGEPSLYINFQENPTQLARTIRGLESDIERARERGLELMYASSVELQIDSIVGEISRRISEGGIRRLVVDSVGDLASSVDDQQRFHDYTYALVQHFTVNAVTSVLTMETLAHLAGAQNTGVAPLSYMCDNIIMLGMGGTERTERTVRIIKTRGSDHDPQVRPIEIGPHGISVGT